MIKRVFRIYPLYLFATFLEIILNSAISNIAPPGLATMVSRALLIGDFFGTPYGLSGVEWTLRIEVIFYLLMATLKAIGQFSNPARLPVIFMAISVGLFLTNPFPNFADWSTGYFNLYFPFLFVGGMIYLIERKLAPLRSCLISISFIFIMFFVLTANIKPGLKETNHAAIALIIFIAAWHFRAGLVGERIIKLLSDLTYSIYLFHVWLWGYIEMACQKLGISLIPLKLQIIILLFLFCYCAHRWVERYGVKFGSHLVRLYKNRTSSDAVNAV